MSYLGGLKEISISLHTEAKEKEIFLIPGKKLCPNCRAKIGEMLKLCDIESEKDDSFIKEVEQFNACRDELTDCFSTIGITPFKTHSQPLHARISYSKAKINKAMDTITEKVALTLNIDKDNLESSNEKTLLPEIIEKANLFDNLMELIKDKISCTSSNSEKIKLLTLVPASWTISQTMNYFNVSQYAAKSARKLFQDKGILATPDNKKGKL